MNDNEQYLQLFFDESTENLQILNQKVLELEKDADNPQEIIDSMFRAAHTLKGMAGTMGFAKLAKLAHEIENLMDALRKEELGIDANLFDLLFKGFDYIDEILTGLKNNSQKDINISKYIKNINAFIDGKEVKVEKEKIGITDVVDMKHEEVIIHLTEKEKSDKTNKPSEELSISPTIRIDIIKLDQLMNMVGELMINKTRLESLDINNTVYKDILSQIDRVTLDLHHIVMKIRMVPLASTFNHFPRLVRDLSKQMKKKVDFIINGKNTELDRSIIDELSEPLVHLLRNAIDHGIETPAVRQKANKTEIGSILLNAYQKGSEIIIEIEDDGYGINPELITKTALQKDLITSQEAEEMSLQDKLTLIFEPGFSTKGQVSDISDISDRGVGLDIVKKAIEDLDGKIKIESEPGIGSRFTISLPLTMAITEALMVKINNEIFAIPLNSITETLQLKLNKVKQVKGQDVIIVRNQTIPLIDSREKLNLDAEYGIYKKQEKVSVVIINSGEKKIGLVVDDLLNQREIVVKSLGDYFKDVKNISGATIIGDGDVALILDVKNIA